MNITRSCSLAIATACVGLMGCPNPNTYTTARTTPPGRLSFTAAPEAWGFTGEVGSSSTEKEKISGAVPMLPTFAMRLGLSDRIDIGGRLPNLTSLAGDVKLNALREETVDLAFDPGLQYYSVSTPTVAGSDASVKVVYLFAPLILDFNLSESVSIVASPGVTFAHASAQASAGSDDRTSVSTSDGTYARLGLGFDFRIAKEFAIHPEVTAQRSMDDAALLMYNVGLGFNLGALPDFSTPASQQL